MIDSQLISFLNVTKIQYRTDVDLKTCTWIRRGGIVDLYITPQSGFELCEISKYLFSRSLEFLTIGHTSNYYFQNSCRIPIIVSTKKCNAYTEEGNIIKCEAGVSVIGLSRRMVNAGVEGFEFLTGLPGTVAAALINNSSCRSNSISDLLESAEVLTPNGQIEIMKYDDFKFGYRTSVFKKAEKVGVILSVNLKKKLGNRDALIQLSSENLKNRERYLEGFSNNLGCTVNSCFSLGRMPIRFFLPYVLFSKIMIFWESDEIIRKKKVKEFLCWISGYKQVATYISDKNPVIFVWRDDMADDVFAEYLDFMKRVFRTDSVEIETRK